MFKQGIVKKEERLVVHSRPPPKLLDAPKIPEPL